MLSLSLSHALLLQYTNDCHTQTTGRSYRVKERYPEELLYFFLQEYFNAMAFKSLRNATLVVVVVGIIIIRAFT